MFYLKDDCNYSFVSNTTCMRFKTPLKTLAILILFFAYLSLSSFTTGQTLPGEALFKKNCQRCHGADGTRGLFGAKNLQVSLLTDEAIAIQIKNGKGFMPAFKKKLSAEEINLVVSFVKSLRRK